MTYLVTSLKIFDPESDATLDTIEEAETHAMERSVSNSDIYGVWVDEDDELLSIAYQGELYTR